MRAVRGCLRTQELALGAGRITSDKLSGAAWVICPACAEAKSGIAYGKVLVSGAFAREHLDQIRRRIGNVDSRAGLINPSDGYYPRIGMEDARDTYHFAKTRPSHRPGTRESLRRPARNTIGRTKTAACSRRGSVRPARKLVERM